MYGAEHEYTIWIFIIDHLLFCFALLYFSFCGVWMYVFMIHFGLENDVDRAKWGGEEQTMLGNSKKPSWWFYT